MADADMADTTVLDPLPTVVGLARTLRGAGIPAGTDRVLLAVQAIAALDASREEDVYWAGRLAFCTNLDELERFDRVFAAYFGGARPAVRARGRLRPHELPAFMAGVPAAETGAVESAESAGVAASASTTEVLRQRDFSSLTAHERQLVARLLDAFALPGELRRSRRRRVARLGELDRRRTMRELLRRGGEPARLRRARRAWRPRRVLVLLDVSGSMSLYASALLRFAHVATNRGAAPTEVFTIGTRLTRVTKELSHPDADSAMAAVSAAIPDWSGGTRLGALLKEFLDTWGQRGLARGTVVVICSDGWERDDPALLGEQMARLARLAHRVVWANPRKAREGYAPIVGGMVAALPYVDDFVEGHSVAALERLARIVAAGAARRTVTAGPGNVPVDVANT